MSSGSVRRSEAQRFIDLERWLVIAIAVHSLAVGVALLFAPRWSAQIGGWSGVEPLFFVRQAGAFHFVVAFGYLFEHLRERRVTLLLLTKSLAFVFLASIWAAGETAWTVPFSAVGDGAMGAAVAWLHRRQRSAP